MLTCKITLPDSPHRVIISKKNPDFVHFISFDRRNSVFSFNKYQKKFFPFWLLASGRKFSFCPKNNGFARVWGLQPPRPSGSYAYECVLCIVVMSVFTGLAPPAYSSPTDYPLHPAMQQPPHPVTSDKDYHY